MFLFFHICRPFTFEGQSRCRIYAVPKDLRSPILFPWEYLVSKKIYITWQVRGLEHAFNILTVVRRLAEMDEYDVAKEGWFEKLKKIKTNFLENEYYTAWEMIEKIASILPKKKNPTNKQQPRYLLPEVHSGLKA